MAERIEKLREAVQELERELESLDSIDPESRALLLEAHEEIAQALEKNEDPAEWKTDSLIERLERAGREFEADHPVLGGVILRTINLLAQMGI